MARNLIGYFGGGPECDQYSVKIIADSASTTFEEIHLAGDSPFVVNYDTTSTPFDPLRLSRASIQVVADEKFYDVFSAEAQGTQVILTNTTKDEIEWVGYLTNNLLNMPQDSCGYESFALEAQDCLYVLEKYDYRTIGDRKSIVTFRQVLGEIAERCGLITDLYIDSSLMRSNGTYIEMGALTVSEQNFYSSDTDKPWNLRQVLEEICRYLGFTAIQYKTAVYLYDMQSHSNFTWSAESDTNMTMNAYRYQKSSNWNTYTQGTFTDLAKGIYLRQGIVRGTGSDVSLETVYQKVTVKDSFYEIDHFIPDFYDDVLLTNREGDFWKCNSIRRTGKFKYISKKGKSKSEEKDEGDYVHYMRKFNHRDYTPIYRDPITLAPSAGNLPQIIQTTNVQQNQENRYDYADGFYTISATFTNTDTISHTIHLRASLTYSWWDGVNSYEGHSTYPDRSKEDDFTLSAGASVTKTLTCHAEYDPQYSYNVRYNCYYFVDSSARSYWLSETSDSASNYVGATIVDLATFDKPMDTSQYNYETEANINFDRYIMIHQADQPKPMHPYHTYYIENDELHGGNALTDSAIENYFPMIMKQNSGYTNPMIIDDKAFLSLDADAIFERYDVEYINPDWTEENSESRNGMGIFRPDAYTVTKAPCLVFKLRVGNKYWSSRANAWTTTEGCFVVNLGTDKTDTDDPDWLGWWNKEHPVLNNQTWTEWAGAKGYKIPLDTSLDFSGDIEFDIMMPSKMQLINDTDYYDGMNNYCWVKGLKIDFATKESLNYSLADVAYENIISSGSVNTLSDITCKFTTYPGQGMHSYSSVGLDGMLLTDMKKTGLDNYANKPEENIIKAYVNQYSSPTIKQTLTLQSYISPFSYVKDPTLNNRLFTIVGTTIDYAMDKQTMTLVEVKPWSL